MLKPDNYPLESIPRAKLLRSLQGVFYRHGAFQVGFDRFSTSRPIWPVHHSFSLTELQAGNSE